MTLAKKVQEVKDKHGVTLQVEGDTVTYPGVKGPDQKGPGTRTFSRADLDAGVFESWFELAHAAGGKDKSKPVSPAEKGSFTSGTSTISGTGTIKTR